MSSGGSGQFIIDSSRSLSVYLDNIRVETDDGAVRWGRVADPWQRADVEAIRPALEYLVLPDAPEPCCRRAWWVRPRGHAKTTDIAVLVSWVLAFSRRKRRAKWIAVDKGQGLEGRQALLYLMQHNPWLKHLITLQAEMAVNTRTGSELEFIAADAEGAYGMINTDLFVLDEVTHWKQKKLWTAVASTFAKRRDAVALCGMNAGFEGSWQHKIDQQLRDDSRWHYSSLPEPTASWITEDRLEEQRSLLTPLEYRRLWGNQWAGKDGEGLADGWIERATVLDGPLVVPEPGYAYTCGIDLSWRRDWSSAVVTGRDVGHFERWENGRRDCGASRIEAKTGLQLARDAVRGMELDDLAHGDDSRPWVPRSARPNVEYRKFGGTGVIKLAAIRLWRPSRGGEIDLEEVGREVMALHALFGLRRVVFDAWQAVLLAQQLKRLGLKVEAKQFTREFWDELARLFVSMFREQQAQIYGDETLLGDLGRARLVEGPYGVKVDSPRSAGTGHGDVLTAFLLSTWGCRQIALRQAPTVGGAAG